MNFEALQIGDLIAEKPLVQGGMGVGVSLGGLAGAVAAQGGVGIISGVQMGFREPDFRRNSHEANLRILEREVKKAKEIASGHGIVGMNIMVAFNTYADTVKAAVKAGISHFGEALRRELKGEGVHVLTVYPGATDTPMMTSSPYRTTKGSS